MEFSPDPDHESIAQAADRLCRDFGDTYWSDCDQRQEFPWAFYEAMATCGWVGISIPEEFGGGGKGQAIQTLGGLGYATEFHVERYW